MWIWIILGLVGVIALVLLLAAFRPAEFAVERSTKIAAPPDRVFPLVNAFRAWSTWSPWEQLDPSMQRTYGGADAGVGAEYSWQGNKKVGQGAMRITESLPNQKVGIHLEFMAPWKAVNPTAFTFTSSDNGTLVQWRMTGTSPYMMRVMGLFMNMDKMIGADFERGLAAMKKVAEAPRA